MLLGLAGEAGSGKDTVYGILRALSFTGPLTSYLVRRDAFADRLKVSAARAIGFNGSWEECIDLMNILKNEGTVTTQLDLFSRKEISGREYLQRYGTEAHREVFDQEFWVKAVLPDGYPSDDERDKTLLVITDVRFPNEATRVHECGGMVWKIDRPQEGIVESTHPSEKPLPDDLVDHVIRNHEDIQFLEKEVKSAVRRLDGVYSS